MGFFLVQLQASCQALSFVRPVKSRGRDPGSFRRGACKSCQDRSRSSRYSPKRTPDFTCGSFTPASYFRMPPVGASTPSFLIFADHVHQEASQLFVVHSGDVHPSRERVFLVHDAHDVQTDASDGGEAFRPVQGSVPHSILAHDDIQNPVEAILDPPVIAGDLQQPLPKKRGRPK